MGALEIRMSSQNLKPLGNFRMPELDTGAAKMWDAQARAAERAAAAARTAGMAEVEGISRRGRIVADTLGHLGKRSVEIPETGISVPAGSSKRAVASRSRS